MALEIDENNLKSGVLGLVVALVEVIRDALKMQAIKRMDSGTLSDDEVERLGRALMELDGAIEEIKAEHDITETVYGIREGLDDIVDDMLDRIINPERWGEDN